MILGAAYYPEFYTKEQWDKDIDMMAEIGFKVVRLAEFAWCRLEPTEGNYDFSWLDEVIEKFAKKGIKTILGTPTGAPPQWIIKKFPDLPVLDIKHSPNNLVGGFGNYCKNHKGYREYSRKIVKAMAEHFAQNDSVFMYQIDNEFMGEPCYCPQCLKAYKEWAESTYGTIQNYNETMMTIFQGKELASFDDIIPPVTQRNVVNPAVLMDYKKFVSDTYYDYCKIQVDEIRKSDNKALVTSNFCTLFNDFDHFKMAELFDIGACDTYPKADFDECLRNSFKLDLTKSLKKENFWVLEQQCSPVAFKEYNYSLDPQEARLYTYKSLAQGADGIVYFRWNATHSGGERYGAGILRHDGEKGRIYHEVKEICDEINSINSFLENSKKPKAKIAMVYSNMSHWALSEGRKITKELDYIYENMKFYDSLLRNNVDIDFVVSGDDLTGYDLVVAPCFAVVSKNDANWLMEYTQNGGNCLFTFISGMFTEFNHISANYYQGNLRELLGIKVTEWAVPYNGENFNFTYKNKNYPANVLNMIIELEGAKSLGEYNSGFYKNTPCVTQNSFGKGNAYYVGASSNDNFNMEIISSIVDLSDTAGTKIIGDRIDVKVREKDGKKLYIAMNYSKYEKELTLKGNFTHAVTGEKLEEKYTIPAYGVLLAME